MVRLGLKFLNFISINLVPYFSKKFVGHLLCIIEEVTTFLRRKIFSTVVLKLYLLRKKPMLETQYFVYYKNQT